MEVKELELEISIDFNKCIKDGVAISSWLEDIDESAEDLHPYNYTSDEAKSWLLANKIGY